MNSYHDVTYPMIHQNAPEHTSFSYQPLPQVTRLWRGEDSKPDFISYCNLNCLSWKIQYEDCEKARKDPKAIKKASTCLLMYREYMECLEQCVQPKVVNNLYGINSRYHSWF